MQKTKEKQKPYNKLEPLRSSHADTAPCCQTGRIRAPLKMALRSCGTHTLRWCQLGDLVEKLPVRLQPLLQFIMKELFRFFAQNAHFPPLKRGKAPKDISKPCFLLWYADIYIQALSYAFVCLENSVLHGQRCSLIRPLSASTVGSSAAPPFPSVLINSSFSSVFSLFLPLSPRPPPAACCQPRSPPEELISSWLRRQR